MMYFCKVTLSVPAFPASLPPPPPFPLMLHPRQQDQPLLFLLVLSLLVKTMRMKTSVVIHFYLIVNLFCLSYDVLIAFPFF